jgi:hypothetical protein
MARSCLTRGRPGPEVCLIPIAATSQRLSDIHEAGVSHLDYYRRINRRGDGTCRGLVQDADSLVSPAVCEAMASPLAERRPFRSYS